MSFKRLLFFGSVRIDEIVDRARGFCAFMNENDGRFGKVIQTPEWKQSFRLGLAPFVVAVWRPRNVQLVAVPFVDALLKKDQFTSSIAKIKNVLGRGVTKLIW